MRDEEERERRRRRRGRGGGGGGEERSLVDSLDQGSVPGPSAVAHYSESA